jgi:hypothetical protein
VTKKQDPDPNPYPLFKYMDPRIQIRIQIHTAKCHGSAALDLATVVLAVFQVARGGTYALWSLCKSKQNRMLIKKAGGFPLLAKLIKSKACALKGLDLEIEF